MSILATTSKVARIDTKSDQSIQILVGNENKTSNMNQLVIMCPHDSSEMKTPVGISSRAMYLGLSDNYCSIGKVR